MPRTPFARPLTITRINGLPVPLVTKAKGGGTDMGQADYAASIRSNVRGFWSGAIPYDAFVHNMILAIDRGFTRAWNEGASECGITPADMTMEERDRLYSEINEEMAYVTDFAIAVEQASRANQGKLTPLLFRAEMWVNRYEEIRSLARSYTCADQKLRWEWNPIKEHCPHCERLNGRVYRASTWKRYNIYPRMPRLKCGGFRCGCMFIPTDDPVTPGRPPMI